MRGTENYTETERERERVIGGERLIVVIEEMFRQT